MSRLSTSKLLLAWRSPPAWLAPPRRFILGPRPLKPRDRRDIGAYPFGVSSPASRVGSAPGNSGRLRDPARRHVSYFREKIPHPAFLGVASTGPFLPVKASTRPTMLCWILLFGAAWRRGTPAVRASIMARESLGTCQKIGLPIVSSAFFKLMSPSEPTRLRTICTFLLRASSLPSVTSI